MNRIGNTNNPQNKKQGLRCDIETLRDTLKIGMEVQNSSYVEGQRIKAFYHGYQFTDAELHQLDQRGQPPETYNIIRLFSRLLLGYLHTRVNNVVFQPQQPQDQYLATILNDLVGYTFRRNRMDTEGDKIKLDFILTGLCCSYQIPVDTGNKDEFGRPIYEIKIHHVPSSEIILDPMSMREDYSDAKYIHRHKWVSKADMHKLFPKKTKEIDELNPDVDINTDSLYESSLEFKFGHSFDGYYNKYDYYKLIHTILVDDNDKVWSIYWCDETILDKQEITFRKVRFPYRVHKLYQGDVAEYYGLFRDVIESARAINQAIIKIQNLCNTTKVFINKKKGSDLGKFIRQVSGVSEVVEFDGMLNDENFRILERSKEIEDQYLIVEKAFERVSNMLGLNEAFLGIGYAYDSGKKSEMNKQSSSMHLTYFTTRIEQFYRLLGEDVANYIKQYYKAHQVVALTDNFNAQQFMEINKPITDENGNPVFEEVLNPEDNEPMIDENGAFLYAPIPTMDSEIKFTDMDIDIRVSSIDEANTQDKIMIDTIIQSTPGQILATYSPALYMKMISTMVANLNNKSSQDISRLFEEAAYMISQSGLPPPAMQQGNEKDSPASAKLKQSPSGSQYK